MLVTVDIGLVDVDVEPSLLVHRACVVKGLIPPHHHRHGHHLLLTTESHALALISAVVAELSLGHLESAESNPDLYRFTQSFPNLLGLGAAFCVL